MGEGWLAMNGPMLLGFRFLLKLLVPCLGLFIKMKNHQFQFYLIKQNVKVDSGSRSKFIDY
jgi:hypothetical protein